MAVNKKTRIVASVSTPVFEIVNDTIARVLTLGADWNQIRLGLRFAMSANTGAVGGANEYLVFGLDTSSGAKYGNVFGTPSTGFHGIVAYVTAPRRDRTAGPPATYHESNATVTAVADIHGTTVATATYVSTALYSSADPDILSAMILEVERGVTDYTARWLYPRSATPVNIPSATLDTAMTAADMTQAQTDLGGSTKYALRTVTLTGAAARVVTYGDLDRVFISAAVPGAGVIVTDVKVFRVN
jgi:hypothetical protein